MTGWLPQCAADRELSGSDRVRVPRHIVEQLCRRRSSTSSSSEVAAAATPARFRAAELGLTVALVEKDKLGGTCLHRGCIPTKALLHAAEVADTAREGEQFGVQRHARAASTWPASTPTRTASSAASTRACRAWSRRARSTLVEGEGRLVAADTVEVGDRQVQRPQRRPGHRLLRPLAARPGDRRPGDHQRPGARRSTTCPSRVVVLGGGVIGVEFASVWKSFGAEVTIVEALPRLVAGRGRGAVEGARAGLPQAQDQLQDRRAVRRRRSRTDSGVTVSPGARRDDRGRPAAGRGRPRPDAAGLGYEEVGVTVDRGFVLTDERLHTNVPNVYAVGDIVPGPAAGAPRLRARHLRGRGDRRARARCRSSTPASRGSPTATPRSPRSASPRRRPRSSTATTRSRPTSTTSAATARARSSRPPASSSSSAQKDGPVVGVHMVGAADGRAGRRGVAHRQLGGLPRGGRPAHPRPPDAERGARRGAPGAGRQAAARPRLTDPDPADCPSTSTGARRSPERRRRAAADV